jgi:hypothetical protein
MALAALGTIKVSIQLSSAGPEPTPTSAHILHQASRLGFDSEHVRLLSEVYGTRESLLEHFRAEGYEVSQTDPETGNLILDKDGTCTIKLVNALRILHSTGQIVDGGCGFDIKDKSRPYQSTDGRVHFEVEGVPSLIFPAPTATMLDGVVDAAAHDKVMREQLTGLIEVFDKKLNQEKVAHEATHLADMLSGTPWGKVLFTGQFLAERQNHLKFGWEIEFNDPRVELRTHLDPRLHDHMLKQAPTLHELLAARLLSELRGFCENPIGMPEYAEAASTAKLGIFNAILGGQSAVEKPLMDWQKFIASKDGYENLGSAELSSIAAAWIIERGSFD